MDDHDWSIYLSRYFVVVVNLNYWNQMKYQNFIIKTKKTYTLNLRLLYAKYVWNMNSMNRMRSTFMHLNDVEPNYNTENSIFSSVCLKLKFEISMTF